MPLPAHIAKVQKMPMTATIPLVSLLGRTFSPRSSCPRSLVEKSNQARRPVNNRSKTPSLFPIPSWVKPTGSLSAIATINEDGRQSLSLAQGVDSAARTIYVESRWAAKSAKEVFRGLFVGREKSQKPPWVSVQCSAVSFLNAGRRCNAKRKWRNHGTQR
jgi:hypothetical protein